MTKIENKYVNWQYNLIGSNKIKKAKWNPVEKYESNQIEKYESNPVKIGELNQYGPNESNQYRTSKSNQVRTDESNQDRNIDLTEVRIGCSNQIGTNKLCKTTYADGGACVG